MMVEEYSLFVRDDDGKERPLGAVSICLDLATAIAGYKAFQHGRRVFVFEGTMIRRLVDPPDREFLADLIAPSSEFGFGMRIRGVRAKGRFGPYVYSPWIESAEFDSGREAMDAFRAKKLKRSEETQVIWRGDPVLSVGTLYTDFERHKNTRNDWDTRLVMLVHTYGTGPQITARRFEWSGGVPLLPKGKNIFVQGPRVCPKSLGLLPDDLESDLFKPA